MSVRQIQVGSTNVSVTLRIIDSTDGTPETGVVFNTSGIDLWYRREGAASVDITEATLAALTTAHTDGGFLHINDGWYRLDLPDAACAAGVTGVQIGGTVTGMVVLAPYIELVAYDPYDSVRLGLTALPNAAADAAGGLVISDAGGLDIDTVASNVSDILTDTGTTIPGTIATAQADLDTITGADGVVIASGTQTFNMTGNITGNLSGSVGSVTGGINTSGGTITTLDGLDTAQDTQHATTQAAIAAIGSSSGGSLNFEATQDNSGGAIDPGSTAFVGVETNNYTDTDLEDGTYHVIEDSTNVIDVVYGFDIGGGRTAAEVLFKGYANANNDDLTISAWDHVGAGWDALDTLEGTNATANETKVIPLLSRHTGTGTERGKVYIRFNGSGLTTSADLNTDQILISAVNIGQTVGYANAIISYDSNASNTNTTAFVDGVGDNPVSTFAALNTLLGSTGITRVHATGTLTLGASFEGYVVDGDNYALALNSQSIAGTIFVKHGPVSGTATGFGVFDTGPIGTVTLANGVWNNNGFSAAFTANSTGNYQFNNCHSQVAGASAPTFDFSGQAGATTVQFRRWSGGITVTLDSDVTMSIDVISGGTVTVNGTGGTVVIRGLCNVVDGSGGSVSITQTSVVNMTKINSEADTALSDFWTSPATLVDLIHDEVIENSLTFRQITRLQNSVLLAKLSGAATTTNTFRDLADSKDRITATVDSDGNRTAITLDGT